MTTDEICTLIKAHQVLLKQGVYDATLDAVFEGLRKSDEHSETFFKLCDEFEL